MAEFTLPANSKVRKDGQGVQGARRRQERARVQDLPLRSGLRARTRGSTPTRSTWTAAARWSSTR